MATELKVALVVSEGRRGRQVVVHYKNHPEDRVRSATRHVQLNGGRWVGNNTDEAIRANDLAELAHRLANEQVSSLEVRLAELNVALAKGPTGEKLASLRDAKKKNEIYQLQAKESVSLALANLKKVREESPRLVTFAMADERPSID